MFKDLLSIVKAEMVNLSKKGPDPVATIKEIRVTSVILKEISRLEAEQQWLLAHFSEIVKGLDYVSKQLMYSGYTELIIQRMRESGTANRILLISLMKAVMTNPEFNTILFLRGLVKAIKNPNTIILSRNGDEGIFVRINLNETAGSIEDYKNAIDKIRLDIMNSNYENQGPGKAWNVTSPELASRLWETMYYGPAREGRPATRRKYNFITKTYEKRDVRTEVVAKYWATMQKRLQVAGKPAPYWEIIDKGMIGMGGSGRAYPIPKATNFVAKAVGKIKTSFIREKNKTKKMLEEDQKLLQKTRADLQAALDSVYLQITVAKGMLKDKSLGKPGSFGSAGEAFFARVEMVGRAYNKDKVAAILKALNMKNLGMISVTAAGRIEITEAGGPRFRISLIGIAREFGIEL